jgi:hypothetical protein
MDRVIDGADSTLDVMEKQPVNPKHRPLREIKLLNVSDRAMLQEGKTLMDRVTGDDTCESDSGCTGVKSVVAESSTMYRIVIYV